MLTLHCPYCGVDAEETELSAGGEAHLVRATVGDNDEAFEEYLFMRENKRGVHLERWRHAFGCGKWFLCARDTMTLEVYGTYPAQTHEPPAEVAENIRAKHPGWSWKENA